MTFWEKEPMLKIEHVSEAGVLNDVSFEAYGGEVLGFSGLVGAGRTETAELLFGATRTTHGEVILDGEKAEIKTPYDALVRGMAFCPEDRKLDGIIGDLSIRENIALAVQARKGFMHPLSGKEQNELKRLRDEFTVHN